MMQESKNQGFPQLLPSASRNALFQAYVIHAEYGNSPIGMIMSSISFRSVWDHASSKPHPSQGEYGGLSDVA
eukprot:scaffold7202_cov195-Cylindrotheca_fusiformis.AAC.2